MEISINPLADLLERQNVKPTRKLSISDQCGYFATMKLGISPVVVAEATGLALSTICHLRSAGENRSGQLRYPSVAREYAQLGHEIFVHRYLTAPIRERIAVAVDRVNRRERASVNSKGFNPAANRYLGRHVWPETSSGYHVIFRIELHPDGCGYFWRNLKPRYELPEVLADRVSYDLACQLNGDPSRGPENAACRQGLSDVAGVLEARQGPLQSDCGGRLMARNLSRICPLCGVEPLGYHRKLCDKCSQFMIDDRKDLALRAARTCGRCYRPLAA